MTAVATSSTPADEIAENQHNTSLADIPLSDDVQGAAIISRDGKILQKTGARELIPSLLKGQGLLRHHMRESRRREEISQVEGDHLLVIAPLPRGAVLCIAFSKEMYGTLATLETQSLVDALLTQGVAW